MVIGRRWDLIEGLWCFWICGPAKLQGSEKIEKWAVFWIYIKTFHVGIVAIKLDPPPRNWRRVRHRRQTVASPLYTSGWWLSKWHKTDVLVWSISGGRGSTREKNTIALRDMSGIQVVVDTEEKKKRIQMVYLRQHMCHWGWNDWSRNSWVSSLHPFESPQICSTQPPGVDPV